MVYTRDEISACMSGMDSELVWKFLRLGGKGAPAQSSMILREVVARIILRVFPTY